jgi:cytidylate kinase
MIITIAGYPGSGKSSVAKLLALHMGYKRYSVGDLLGRMAVDRNMTINELMTAAETDPQIDRDADAYQTKLSEEENDFVIDSRLGFHFIPQSFKVFLAVDPKVGAERIYNEPGSRPDEPKAGSIEETQAIVAARVESERKRYEEYYGLANYTDRSHFDLVVDSTHLSIQQVVEKITDAIGA